MPRIFTQLVNFVGTRMGGGRVPTRTMIDDNRLLAIDTTAAIRAFDHRQEK